MNAFEQKVADQVDLTKVGVYEVFVNEGELREYYGLSGDKTSKMMKKMFAPVYNGEVITILESQSKAIRELLDEAGVDTLEELEALKK